MRPFVYQINLKRFEDWDIFGDLAIVISQSHHGEESVRGEAWLRKVLRERPRPRRAHGANRVGEARGSRIQDPSQSGETLCIYFEPFREQYLNLLVETLGMGMGCSLGVVDIQTKAVF